MVSGDFRLSIYNMRNKNGITDGEKNSYEKGRMK